MCCCSSVRRGAARVLASCVVVIVLLPIVLRSANAADQEAAKPAEKPAAQAPATDSPAAEAEKSPATATVQAGTIKISLDLDGTFVAQTSEEIAVRPEEWGSAGPLVVESAAKHGALVKRGDVLIQFDTAKIDRAIDDLRADLEINQLSLRQAEQSLQALEEFTPIDLKANERLAKMSDEDQRYYFDKQRPFDLKVLEFSLQSSKNSLEYAEEELKQLEKMYEADDLTEESEAIVLKRARNTVEAAKISLASAQMRYDFATQFSLARADESTRESALRTRLQTQRTAVALPVALEKQRLEVAKLNQQRLRSEERLKKLEADRAKMTVKSPLEGIVYYGKAVRGKFSDSATQAESLRPFGNVQPNQVVMTVVQPQPLSVLVSIPEDKLYRIRTGLAGTAIPKAYPDSKLPVTAARISSIPTGPGTFEGEFRVSRGGKADQMVPGMACKVEVVPYLKRNALHVPPKAVMTDEKTDETYVWLVDKNGKPERRPVTVGEKTESQAEILKGLAAGDKVLLEAPQDKK
ncbi:MAG: HlyD family efflux transporter periplasmic adaptor subunit [Pirellulaceae bacterium]|nr:HlyD family efflux transporter periplasmic adaptor subunit [Pirellulaceae bacterium]